MEKLNQIIKKHLNELLNEQNDDGTYMVLSNLVRIKNDIETILKFKHHPKFKDLVTNEHAWAGDHIATSKDDIQEVANFIETYIGEMDELNEEEKMKGEDPCWKGYEMVGKKMKNGKEVPNCVPKKKVNEAQIIQITDEQFNRIFEYKDDFGSTEETEFVPSELLAEAEYQGRKVQLGKIMQGDIKKFKVYVKNDKGKVVKVNFGFGGKSAHGKFMKIKKNNPERRKSFRARMKCDNPGPRWKPRYWSCRAW